MTDGWRVQMGCRGQQQCKYNCAVNIGILCCWVRRYCY